MYDRMTPIIRQIAAILLVGVKSSSACRSVLGFLLVETIYNKFGKKIPGTYLIKDYRTRMLYHVNNQITGE